MNSERIKEIQAETAYPQSRSVHQALLKVWNECEQGSNKNIYGEKDMLRFAQKYAVNTLDKSHIEQFKNNQR